MLRLRPLIVLREDIRIQLLQVLTFRRYREVQLCVTGLTVVLGNSKDAGSAAGRHEFGIVPIELLMCPRVVVEVGILERIVDAEVQPAPARVVVDPDSAVVAHLMG